MKNRFLLLTCLSLTLFIVGCIDSPMLRSYSTPKGYARIMMPRFLAHGANSVDVSAASNKLDARPTDNWVAVWSDIASDYEQRSQKNIENNNLDDGKYQLLKASVYYRIAAYPFPYDEKHKTANDKSMALFKNYIKFMDNPPKIITLSIDTLKITGYFRKPPQTTQKVPLVIILPGIDSSKEEMFWVEENFLDKGFATFSMDIPGTGECGWPMRSDSIRMFTKVVDYFKNDSSIISDKIAVVGFNFGGYWALRLAASNAGIKGAVAIDAPIHYTFEQNHLNQMPRYMSDMFVKITGAANYQEMFNILSAMSLKTQDLLKNISTPVLVIYPGKDLLIRPEETLLLSKELTQPTALKIYDDEDLGMINNLQSKVYPLIADWTEKLFDK